MQAAIVSVFLVSASLAQVRTARPPQPFYGHGPIRKDELEQQQQAFKQWWGDELVTKLADLPAEGKVPEFRVPYSGHDYPDRGGGTIASLSKYDQAYHRGRQLATEYERMDVGAHRGGRLPGRDYGPQGGARRTVCAPCGRMRSAAAVPTWYGHCNGWTAAAIRHAEPQKSVVRNGVTFTPADIKGLLAEIYMYSDSEFLGGIDPAINPGVLHVMLGNWLGRGSHPVGMETAVGEVVINFPVFNYKSVVNKLNNRESEVQTWITYALNTNRETDKGPAKYNRQMYFHYVLDFDDNGAIRGGRYYGDSQQIDMLWTPLKPAQGGHERNKRGNPHLDIKEVLAIWRESVPEDLRKKWLNIDPTEEDRMLPPTEAVAVTEKPADAQPPPKTTCGTATAATSTSAESIARPGATNGDTPGGHELPASSSGGPASRRHAASSRSICSRCGKCAKLRPVPFLRGATGTMQLTDFKWPDIAALSRDMPVVIPIAALEQHGRHMPLFTDSLLLGEVIRRVSERLKDRVLFTPLMWLGNSEHHLDFPGTMTAAPRVYLDLLKDMAENFLFHGFRRIVLVNGHGGNIVPGQQAMFELRQKYRQRNDLTVAFHDVLDARGQAASGRSLVRAERDGPRLRVGNLDDAPAAARARRRLQSGAAAVSQVEAVRAGASGWITKDRSKLGHIGQPRQATAEKGENAVSAVRG